MLDTLSVRPRGPGVALEDWHVRLEEHFRGLRTQREQVLPGAPVFVLEHGLSLAERTELVEVIRDAVEHGLLSERVWLPVAVYAAEIGYDYSGDQYWPLFEERAPGWTRNGDRSLLPRVFGRFVDTFGGAIPKGAWAKQFSNISWPITHAILPLDLQQQLIRVLRDCRHSLSAELLADYAGLGRVLAGRAWDASSRFRTFAQNTALLGQVAAGLLTSDEEESPYLLGTTLRRIVDDLSTVRSSYEWLWEVRGAASQVRTHGLTRGSTGGSKSSTHAALLPVGSRAGGASDLRMELRQESAGWRAYLLVPSLTGLCTRFPAIADDLARARPVIAGANDRFVRGALLYPDREYKLASWPERNVPPVQVDQDTGSTNEVLINQCAPPPGPPWLFADRGTGVAVEIRGRQLRAGQAYVVVFDHALDDAMPSWCVPCRSVTSGVEVYSLSVPDVLTEADHDWVTAVGLGMITDVEVWPVGQVPAWWNGQGTAEWLEGDLPIIGVSSTRAASHVLVGINGRTVSIPWPDRQRVVLVDLGDLPVGVYDIDVAPVAEGEQRPLVTGILHATVRPARTDLDIGSRQQGILLLPTPARVRLEELWDETAAIEAIGMAGAPVQVDIALLDARGAVLASHVAKARLPIDRNQWRALFRPFRKNDKAKHAYEFAESAVITCHQHMLAPAKVRCERTFAPLRWSVGQDRDGPYARLIDHSDGQDVTIERLDYAYPDRPIAVDLSESAPLRVEAGTLLTARVGSYESSVIVPPKRALQGSDRLTAPRLARLRSSSDVWSLIQVAHRWSAAARPDTFADYQRIMVLARLTTHLVSELSGRYWSNAEWRSARYQQVPDEQWRDAVGKIPYQQELAQVLDASVSRLTALAPEERVGPFAALLRTYGRPGGVEAEDEQLAEFLLRLASNPASLAMWSSATAVTLLDRIHIHPVLMRAARFVVLMVHARSEGEPEPYAGWSWD